MNAGQCSAQAGAGQLQQLHADGLQLATRSLQLLSLADPREQQAYAATNRDACSSDLSFITCMAVIRQTADEVRCRVDMQEKGDAASAANSYHSLGCTHSCQSCTRRAYSQQQSWQRIAS